MCLTSTPTVILPQEVYILATTSFLELVKMSKLIREDIPRDKSSQVLTNLPTRYDDAL